MIGYFLDNKRFTVKQRARWSFIALMVFNLALWLAIVILSRASLIDAF